MSKQEFKAGAPAEDIKAMVDKRVMARLRKPFTCEFIQGKRSPTDTPGRWRITDANGDAIASVAPAEEGYARLIVAALNAYPLPK
jgi:hypothetical protein